MGSLGQEWVEWGQGEFDDSEGSPGVRVEFVHWWMMWCFSRRTTTPTGYRSSGWPGKVA